MENTVEFVERGHDRPFFVWCGFCGPHGPVDPPAPYDALYSRNAVPLPPNYRVTEFGECRSTTQEQDRIARKFIAGYWGLVTLIDDMIGRVLRALESAGVLDNTLIAFTSDHGEMGFDFGRLGKGNFYEPVVRVPLIVVPPGGITGGRTASGPVECFDLAPTILDYARAEVPDNMSASSLRPLIEGRGEGRPYALCEYLSNDRKRAGVCLRTPHAKYVQWTDGVEKFFDLEQDPLERTNLIDDSSRRAEIDEHRRSLIHRLSTTGRGAYPA
ncbi:MAG: sulfatase-like hydrolase/transferase [Kiritimatiellaeota bacterium]|nr:sulfatase-like hydrolase/transferase [Kiritimatiellota bacterium]